MRMDEGPKRLDPLGLYKPKEEDPYERRPLPANAMSVSEFRSSIFHLGISRTIDHVFGDERTIHDLATEFEGKDPWAKNANEPPANIIKFFEDQLEKLQTLSVKLNETPNLPKRKSGILSFALTVFPIAEQEWAQVEWPLTSDVQEFNRAVLELVNPIKECDFILPQGGFYIPSHLRMGLSEEAFQNFTINREKFSDLTIDLFLLSVSFERASHVINNGYSTVYTRILQPAKTFKPGFHELVVRIPALSKDITPGTILGPTLEVHECLTAKKPVERASESLEKISLIVRDFSGGNFVSVADMVRNSRDQNISDRYGDLRTDVYKELQI